MLNNGQDAIKGQRDQGGKLAFFSGVGVNIHMLVFQTKSMYSALLVVKVIRKMYAKRMQGDNKGTPGLLRNWTRLPARLISHEIKIGQSDCTASGEIETLRVSI